MTQQNVTPEQRPLNARKLIQWLTTPENWDHPSQEITKTRAKAYQILLDNIHTGIFNIKEIRE